MGFRSLRVINDDLVMPRMGFGKHPHRDMEIITYILSGSLAHQDSMGNGRVITAGEFQYMAAGTGVQHSEQNPSRHGGGASAPGLDQARRERREAALRREVDEGRPPPGSFISSPARRAAMTRSPSIRMPISGWPSSTPGQSVTHSLRLRSPCLGPRGRRRHHPQWPDPDRRRCRRHHR